MKKLIASSDEPGWAWLVLVLKKRARPNIFFLDGKPQRIYLLKFVTIVLNIKNQLSNFLQLLKTWRTFLLSLYQIASKKSNHFKTWCEPSLRSRQTRSWSCICLSPSSLHVISSHLRDKVLSAVNPSGL